MEVVLDAGAMSEAANDAQALRSRGRPRKQENACSAGYSNLTVLHITKQPVKKLADKARSAIFVFSFVYFGLFLHHQLGSAIHFCLVAYQLQSFSAGGGFLFLLWCAIASSAYRLITCCTP